MPSLNRSCCSTVMPESWTTVSDRRRKCSPPSGTVATSSTRCTARASHRELRTWSASLNVEPERSVLFANSYQTGDLEYFSVDLVEAGWGVSFGPSVSNQYVAHEQVHASPWGSHRLQPLAGCPPVSSWRGRDLPGRGARPGVCRWCGCGCHSYGHRHAPVPRRCGRAPDRSWPSASQSSLGRRW
jgi:hypothetical protein